MPETAVLIHPSPFFAAIFRAEKSALFRLDHRVDAIRIRAGNGHTDSPENSFRKSIAFESLPGDAAIFGSIKSAARPAAGKKPGLPTRLPERRKNDIGIMRIKDDIDSARVLIFAQNFRPRFPSIGRAKNPTLWIRTEDVPERRDENDVRVLRIDNQRTDRAGVF